MQTSLGHRIQHLLLILFPVMFAGCGYYQSYHACDLNCTQTYPLTCESVRVLPCGAAPIEYGYRSTHWSEWPGDRTQRSCPECEQEQHAFHSGELSTAEPVEPESTPATPPPESPDPLPAEPPFITPGSDTLDDGAQVESPTGVSLAAAVEPKSTSTRAVHVAGPQWQPGTGPRLPMPRIVDERATENQLASVCANSAEAAAKHRTREEPASVHCQSGVRRESDNDGQSNRHSLELRHFAPRRHKIELR